MSKKMPTLSSSSGQLADTTHMDYEATVMYGKYSRDLAECARAETQRIKLEKEIFERGKPPELYSKTFWGRSYHRAHGLKVRLYQHIGAEWVFLLLLGIIMALLSFAMDYAIQKCQKAHYWLYTELDDYIALQYLAWVFFPLSFVVFSVGFVHIVSPQAIGSGIPEMKTIMRGIVLHEYLTFRVLIAKMIGLTASLGSRLPLGKEGPFVHIASVVATLLNKFLINFANPFDNESRTYEMLAAACAVGVACNFAAPIGGVLFSIEVTATYFAVRNYWRGFFGAVCGALVFRLLAVWNKDEATITSLFKTNFPLEFPYDLQELLAFVGIGVACGFAGALFVYMHRQIVEFNRNHKKVSAFLQRHRFVYPVMVSLLISSLTYPRGFGQFMAGELTTKEALDTLFDNKTWAKLGYIDESDVAIEVQEGWKHPLVNIFVTLVIFIVTHFFMTAIAITLPVPSGCFIPVFLIGAAFGRLVGESMAALFPDGFHEGSNNYRIVPGGYAVVGAASLSGAVTHTISTSVIVFELTGQISHILPVMIAVLISNAIAQWLQPSIYDSIILIKGLPYLPDVSASKRKLYSVFVQDFMVRDVKYISYTSTYKEVQTLLAKSRRLKSFPIVDAPDSMILLGSIQRHTLEHLLESKLIEEGIKNSKTKPKLPDSSLAHQHNGNCDVVDGRKKVKFETQSPAKEGHSVDADLRSIASSNSSPEIYDSHHTLSRNVLLDKVDFDNCQVDPAPFQLVERTSLHKVHSLFSLLGLGHAYVTSVGRLVGVVSLKELRVAIQGTTANQNESRRPKTTTVKYNHAAQEITSLRVESDGSDSD